MDQGYHIEDGPFGRIAWGSAPLSCFVDRRRISCVSYQNRCDFVSDTDFQSCRATMTARMEPGSLLHPSIGWSLVNQVPVVSTTSTSITMSGRLIILPKKSYCPWNPDNVARVERDEAAHRQDQERRLSRPSQSTRRIMAVQQQQQSDVKEPRHHVNLFQIEQDEATAAATRETAKSAKSKLQEIPFYMQPASKAKAAAVGDDDKQEHDCQRKASLDPAMSFMPPGSGSRNGHRRRRHDDATNDYSSQPDGPTKPSSKHTSKHEKRRSRRTNHHYDRDDGDESTDSRHKSKRSKHHDKTTSAPESLLLADLRQRRHEREAAERRRQEIVLGGRVKLSQQQRYNDQFYPKHAR